ncbi:MAG: hypothetical protein ACKVOR_06470 [Flavobacteriales bacterium]
MVSLLCDLHKGNFLVAQSDSVGVFIQRDEHSPFTGPNTYMWVDVKNIITSTQIGLGELLKVHTNNGYADQPFYYGKDQFAITPIEEGEVTVFAIQKVKVGDHWDTITTVNYFTAVPQPELRLMILNDSIRMNGSLEFYLADKYEFTQADLRYVISGEYRPMVYDERNEMIGRLPASKGTKLRFNPSDLTFVIEKGYRIIFQVLVRDLQTDLLFPADEWVHIVE